MKRHKNKGKEGKKRWTNLIKIENRDGFLVATLEREGRGASENDSGVPLKPRYLFSSWGFRKWSVRLTANKSISEWLHRGIGNIN